MKLSMRLFVAVNFEEKIKLKLVEAQNYLKRYAVRGNFSLPQNFHLTLVFLGEIETEKLTGIKNAIDKVNIKPFKICINNSGRFQKDDGDIYWIGINPSFNLTQLRIELLANLKEISLNILTGKFSPHITIARRTRLNKDFNIDSFNHYFGNTYSDVKKISLMESVKISEKLVYNEIYFKELSNNF